MDDGISDKHEAGTPALSRASDDGEIDIKRYLSIVRRRIWVVVTCFIIITTLGAVRAFRATPIYRASAMVLIERQAPPMMDFQNVGGMIEREYYSTQKELVRSRAVLEKALEQPEMQQLFKIETAGNPETSFTAEIRRTISAVLGNPPVTPAKPWERLKSVVIVEFVPDTHLLQVMVESGSSNRAAFIANAVAHAFEDYHRDCEQQDATEAYKFLNTQKDEQSKVLDAVENDLQQFRETAKVVSLDDSDKGNPVLVRYRGLNDELTRLQMTRGKLDAQFKVLEQALGRIETDNLSGNEEVFSLPVLKDFPAVRSLRNELTEAEQAAKSLAVTYGPDAPQMQSAKNKIDMQRTAFRESLQEALAQARNSTLAELEVLKFQEDALEKQYREQTGLALGLARESSRFARLQRNVQREREYLGILMDHMQRVDMNKDYDKTNVRVVEETEIPRWPVRPRKGRMVAISVFLALILGLGLAFLLEHLDDTIKTPEDMESRLGVPVLGFVPQVKHLNGFANVSTIVMSEPHSNVTESFRNIRTNLFFSAPPEKMKVLAVISGGLGDGKTVTSCNLAVVIAQSGKKVLLIDGDLRRSRVGRAFGLQSRIGLSNILVRAANLDEAVQNVACNGEAVENLDVLVSGPKPPNPAELLGSDAMRNLLNDARARYDRVIIDTPALLFVADAGVVASMSDGVILVAKAANNSRALLNRVRSQLAGVGARLLGGILNNVRLSRVGYYYSDYYYGYYGYHGSYGSYYSKENEEMEQEGQGEEPEAEA